MHIIVSKFGGSSMADAGMFQRVRHIIQNKRHPHYIVLSAPGRRTSGDEKITDLLCKAHDLLTNGKDPVGVIRAIQCRFEEIASSLKIAFPEGLSEQLKNDVLISRDYAASRGEYLCARLFAEYASLPFVDAAELIHFDKSGRLDRMRTCASIREMSKRLPCAVIPGFYGSMPSGRIRTFSRGGSDITGALVAAALHADVYENWTDVDGLMSIDPALCPEALHHPCVSYRQMQELSLSGAGILHPSCLEPVRISGIPTVLRNTFHPERRGTYISDQIVRSVPCICIRRSLHLVRLNDLNAESKELAAALSANVYISGDRDEFLLSETALSKSFPVSMISIFSPSDLAPEAVRIADPIAWNAENECLRLITSPDPKPETLSRLHGLLIDESQQCQNSSSA